VVYPINQFENNRQITNPVKAPIRLNSGHLFFCTPSKIIFRPKKGIFKKSYFSIYFCWYVIDN